MKTEVDKHNEDCRRAYLKRCESAKNLALEKQFDSRKNKKIFIFGKKNK